MKSPKELDILSELALHENCSEYHQRENKHEWYSHRNSYNHKISGVSPYKIAQRLIEGSIGKSFDDVFSYYCTLVPVCMQYIFLENFSEDEPFSRWYRGIHFEYDGFYVDDDRLIRETKHTPPSFIFYSFDYYAEWEHVPTIKNGRNFYNYSKGKELVIKSGFTKTFTNKNDLEFKKLRAEKKRLVRSDRKKKERIRKETIYCFLTKDEIQRKKDKELDLITRDRHGFNAESFVGIEYSGQKRKIK